MAGNDKRLYKLIANDGTELQALSPPQTYIGSPVSGTPTVGPNAMPVLFVRSASTSSGAYQSDQPQFCNTINKKILFHLISTLNTAFHPDYDFTDARSDEFSLEPSLNWTMSSVKSNLSAALGDSYSSFEQQLWSAIEEEIQLKECEIYRSDNLCVMLLIPWLLNMYQIVIMVLAIVGSPWFFVSISNSLCMAAKRLFPSCVLEPHD